MTTRTTTADVAFARPFQLPGMEAAYPAGTYWVETDHESIDTLSHTAFRRTTSRIHLRRPGITEVVSIDWKDLEAALLRDAAG
jgi:hypothetical protein